MQCRGNTGTEQAMSDGEGHVYQQPPVNKELLQPENTKPPNARHYPPPTQRNRRVVSRMKAALLAVGCRPLLDRLVLLKAVK